MNNHKDIPFSPPAEADKLLAMINGYQTALLIKQALASKIFDALQVPACPSAVSSTSGYKTDRLVLLLDALSSLGLLVKNGAEYVNSPAAASYLVSSSRFYLGDLIEMDFAPEQSRSYEMLQPWLKGEYHSSEMHNPLDVFQPGFIHAMAQATFSNKNWQETVALISNHPCVKASRNLLDLGGGHGLYAIALKHLHPQLNAVVFDLAQVETVTRAYASEYGVELGFQAGNFYEDKLPANQDIVLTFDILHPVTPPQKEAVFTKVFHALNQGGYLFYKLWFLDDSRTRPSQAAVFALKQKIRNQHAHVYTRQEAENMLGHIGFQVEKAVPCSDLISTILIARKVG